MLEINEIEKFLNEKKDSRIKSKIKEFKKKNESFAEEDEQIIKENAEIEFDFKNWVVSKSKTANQIFLSSHPSKFSHPDAKTSNIFFTTSLKNDGYLKTGGVDCKSDFFGNAAQIDIVKFLNIKIDNKTLLQHLEEETPESKELFNFDNISYDEIRKGFLSIKLISSNIYTSKLIKQIFSPVNNKEYHLLSILTNSSICSLLNSKIKEIKYSEKNKELRKLKSDNKFSSEILEEIKDLVVIGIGGSNPQNISNINKNNAGKFYLLKSLPPMIERREIRIPKKDFFYESLNFYQFKWHFDQLDKLFQDRRDNKPIRDSITNIVGEIVDKVIEIIYKIRDFKLGWSEEENYKNLPKNQKILLDNHHQDLRAQDEWLDDFTLDLARFIKAGYTKFHKDFAKDFGDAELLGFERRINLSQEIEESLNQAKETLKC